MNYFTEKTSAVRELEPTCESCFFTGVSERIAFKCFVVFFNINF